MRGCSPGWTLAAAGIVTALSASADAPPIAHEVLAGGATDLSVTVYRSPYRSGGSINLDYLNGFALIRETRMVRVPAGLSRVRFEGVADGIEPVSAILAGLPGGLIEKNLDAQLLSPATLLASAADMPVTLVRSDPKTGRTQRLPGVILSGASADGVVLQTREGIEALRCSGLPEGFAFNAGTKLGASPTLSVLVRSEVALNARIELSYLAHGFDWAADYTAALSSDAKTIDLGAWVTLANGNGIGFPQARTQVVAGRVNREGEASTPLDAGGAVLARCWPSGSTSDTVGFLVVPDAVPAPFKVMKQDRAVMLADAAVAEVAVTGARVSQEQLGDLKLYRVPDRTTVASRQSKQVRLFDRTSIPVNRIYRANYVEGQSGSHPRNTPPDWVPAMVLLRTRNDVAHRLGVPLPSGHVAVFQSRGRAQLLLNEAELSDRAVNEEVEIAIGTSSDVQTRFVTEEASVDPRNSSTIPLVPGVSSLRVAHTEILSRLTVTNATSAPIEFELRLQLNEATHVIRADRPLITHEGHRVLAWRVASHHTDSVSFVVQHATTQAIRSHP